MAAQRWGTLDLPLSTEKSRTISGSITMLAIELFTRLSGVATSAHGVRLARSSSQYITATSAAEDLDSTFQVYPDKDYEF